MVNCVENRSMGSSSEQRARIPNGQAFVRSRGSRSRKWLWRRFVQQLVHCPPSFPNRCQLWVSYIVLHLCSHFSFLYGSCTWSFFLKIYKQSEHVVLNGLSDSQLPLPKCSSKARLTTCTCFPHFPITSGRMVALKDWRHAVAWR